MQFSAKVRGLDALQWPFHVHGLLHNRGPSIAMATIEQAAVYLAQEMHQGMQASSGKMELEIFHQRRACWASLKSESVCLYSRFW